MQLTFANEKEVLAYIGKHILLPTWKDPVCGDSNCEYPWEFPAFGRFGCAVGLTAGVDGCHLLMSQLCA